MRAILPGPMPDVDQILAVFELEMGKVGEELKAEFEATVENWKEKPQFQIEFTSDVRRMTVKVFTTDEIYGYVSRGTPPHIIKPKKDGGVLRFQTGYISKTLPGIIVTRGGGEASGDTVFAKEVHHPGTEARDFPGLIRREYEGRYRQHLLNALFRGAEALRG